MTRVKICGITNLEDATVAVQAGTDLIGFVFYPPSPRYIAPERAHEIVERIRHDCANSAQPSLVTRYVGVFVNDSLKRVRAVMTLAQLDYAQLHGDESVEMVRALSPHVYKSLRPRNVDEAKSLITNYRSTLTPAFIIDAFDAKQFGGMGKRADWEIAGEIARTFPILLAGGLSAENVADAIRIVQPWGVDVSSGVERAPGLKDHARVKEFIRTAKSMTANR